LVPFQFGAVAEKDPVRGKFPNEHCTFPLMLPEAEKPVNVVKIVALPEPFPPQLPPMSEPNREPLT